MMISSYDSSLSKLILIPTQINENIITSRRYTASSSKNV